MNLREKFAEIAHDAWAGWMKYMLKRVEIYDHEPIPKGFEPYSARWKRQMNTAYADLPETEKKSDREEADKYLKAFQENAAEEIKTIDGLINYISETTEELHGPQREWFHDHLGQIALAARRIADKGEGS